MTKKLHPDILRILNWVRVDFDIDLPDLPKGSIKNEHRCPLAHVLQMKYPKAGVGNQTYCLEGYSAQATRWRVLPPFAQVFVGEFDHGLWPEYEEDV